MGPTPSQPKVRSKPAVPSARRRNRQATTEALKQAAIEVFASKGYDAASTQEVARTAGVSEQLIQRYFGGKSGLLMAIMSSYAENDRAGRFGRPPAAKTLAAEIAGFLIFHLRREREYGNFARVAIYRSIVDADIASQVSRMFTESREPYLVSRLTELRHQGLISSHANLRATSHALSTLSFAFAFNDQLIFRRDTATLTRTIRSFSRTIAKGLQP